MDKKDEVAVLPTLSSLFRQYSRYSYQQWTAISEFVDNSTESWFQNKQILKEYGREGIVINIQASNGELIITDNAYGMNFEKFKNAISLGKKPEETSRNQYGYGLKTAACWFGDRWSITSSEFGSDMTFSTLVDIDELELKNQDKLIINTSANITKQHGTTIKIMKVNHDLLSAKTRDDIINNLAMKYRRDINSGEIKITFNGTEIVYLEPEVLVYQGKKWIKNIEFSFEHNGKKYSADGKVGIFKKGTKDPFLKSGFSLFTSNRTIVGGLDKNYKPNEIFQSKKSKIENKLFGELNLSGFEVSQAKDQYLWEEGLEAKFIAKLKDTIIDYIQIANKGYKELVDVIPQAKDDRKVEEEKEFEELVNSLEPKNNSSTSSSSNSVNEQIIVAKSVDRNNMAQVYEINADFIPFKVRVDFNASFAGNDGFAMNGLSGSEFKYALYLDPAKFSPTNVTTIKLILFLLTISKIYSNGNTLSADSVYRQYFDHIQLFDKIVRIK